MDQKRKLKGIADLYALEDARKLKDTRVTSVTPVTPVTGDSSNAEHNRDEFHSVTLNRSENHLNTNDKLITRKSLSSTEQAGNSGSPIQVTGDTPVTRVTMVTGVSQDPAPRRDFTRVANSIVRDAIPSGAFTGKGKQLYDYLYTQTRGAIVPTRSVRLPSEKLMAGAGMSRKTLRFHLERLRNIGLIDIEERPGTHGGNLYTVNLPEEVEMIKSNPGNPGNQGTRGDKGYSGEKIQREQGLESHPGNPGLNQEDSRIYTGSNTYLKTNTDDDTHILGDFTRIICHAVKEVGGGSIKSSEQEKIRWREAANLLASELIKASNKTGAVTSPAAFFAEHLRRAFFRRESSDQSKERNERGKDKRLEGNQVEQKQKNRAEAAGAKSMFSFEERRRYAQNQQPPLGNGWLVESGTGKYDEVIEAWSKQQTEASAAQKPDDKNCPDCRGTGMYYPEGYGKGAAKCRHERMIGEVKSPRRLSDEEISERISLIRELIEDGYTLDQAQKQFSSSMHPEDWESVRSGITSDEPNRIDT